MATLSEAQTQLSQWEAASAALATGSSYSIGGRSLTRAQWPEVRDAMTFWRREVSALSAVASGARDGRIKVIVRG
jgi:hypothetical protein